MKVSAPRKAGAKRRAAVLAAALLVLLGPFAGPATGQDRPNIVVILADNLGYGDLGSYGSRVVETPTLDRLARGGVRLTQYYVAHTVCSPSRAALLTGRQPFRAGIIDVLRPDSPTGLPADEITLAEVLREQGYATAAVGKWHLGDRPGFLPLQHGFDQYFGIPYSMDMLPHALYDGDRLLEPDAEVTDITERYTDRAIAFIRDHREQPFFLWMSHTIPHLPLRLSARHRAPGAPLYADAIRHLDGETGRLLEALAQYNLSEKTLIVFTSDNGPMRRGSAGGLRGGIGDYYEGGIRVPFIAYWPGVLPAGRVVEAPVIAYDLFPTLVGRARGRAAADRAATDRVYDGQDVWPLLTGTGGFERRQPFVFVYHDVASAVRDGRWKLHVAHRGGRLAQPQLYDLHTDPEEAYPVNDRYPDVLERLQNRLRTFQADLPKVWSLQYPVRDPQKRPSGVDRGDPVPGPLPRGVPPNGKAKKTPDRIP